MVAMLSRGRGVDISTENHTLLLLCQGCRRKIKHVFIRVTFLGQIWQLLLFSMPLGHVSMNVMTIFYV